MKFYPFYSFRVLWYRFSLIHSMNKRCAPVTSWLNAVLSMCRCICRYDALRIISSFFFFLNCQNPDLFAAVQELTLGRHYPDASWPRIRVAHRHINTGVVISRRSRARAVVRAIQTPFFVIYDNTYAVERITVRAASALWICLIVPE